VAKGALLAPERVRFAQRHGYSPNGTGKRSGRTSDGPRKRLSRLLGCTITDGKITGIDVTEDPDRRRQLDLAVLGD
jgi:hypothetical protein